MKNNIVKYAEHCHLDQIINIEKKSYNNPWTENHFQKDIDHECSINYICFSNYELAGYLFGYLIKDEYYLNKITVKKECRRNRIGRLIFSHCLDNLIKKQVKSIQLEVSSLNLVAQKFYENLNFTDIGIRKDYYSKNEHALLYILEL